MNKQEAAKVLAVLSSAYTHTVTEQEAEVWYGVVLEHCDPMVAGMAAERLIAEDQFWPTPARFNETRKAIERGREPAVKALPQPGRTEAEKEHARKCLAEARRLIKENAWKPNRPVKGFKTLGESLGEMLDRVAVEPADGWLEDAREIGPTGRPR